MKFRPLKDNAPKKLSTKQKENIAKTKRSFIIASAKAISEAEKYQFEQIARNQDKISKISHRLAFK